MKITFFKTQKPKIFKYRPLYYNEQKEELDKIKKAVQDESDATSADRVRVQLQRSWSNRSDRRRNSKVSTLKLLIYLVALILAIYFMFFGKIF